jgi:hypothetical protein
MWAWERTGGTRSRGGGVRLSRAGRDVVAGLKEVAAHIRGEIKLPTREYEVPGPVDVKAIRSKPGIPEKIAPSGPSPYE